MKSTTDSYRVLEDDEVDNTPSFGAYDEHSRKMLEESAYYDRDIVKEPKKVPMSSLCDDGQVHEPIPMIFNHYCKKCNATLEKDEL